MYVVLDRIGTISRETKKRGGKLTWGWGGGNKQRAWGEGEGPRKCGEGRSRGKYDTKKKKNNEK